MSTKSPLAQQPLLLTHRFTDAVEYVTGLHTEMRKGTQVPYVAHLLGVAAMVMGENGYVSIPVTEDMCIAALLHDAVEDHGGAPRLEEIRARFGPDVARMVEGLSDSITEDASQKKEWRARKQEYLDHLKKDRSLDTQLISAADKLYNARAILEDYRLLGPALWKRFKRGAFDQIWYFEELIRSYDPDHPNRIVDELRRVVAELKRACEPELNSFTTSK